MPSFVSGKDVFGILPTGYGTSLHYKCLRDIFDGLREDGLLSIIIVVTPSER